MDFKMFMVGRKAGKTYLMNEWMKQQIEQMAQPSDKPLPFGIRIVSNDIVPENEIWMIKDDETGVKFKMNPPELPREDHMAATMYAMRYQAPELFRPSSYCVAPYDDWEPSIRLENIYRGSIARLDKRKKRRLKRKGQWTAFEAMRAEYAIPDAIKKELK